MTAPLPMLTTLFVQTANAGTTATGIYTDGTGDTLITNWTLGTPVFNPVTDFTSFDGTWSYGGGTGAYAGLGGGGGGTLAVSQFNTPGTYSGTVLVGELTPEPEAFAVFGVGLLGLLLRRKRA